MFVLGGCNLTETKYNSNITDAVYLDTVFNSGYSDEQIVEKLLERRRYYLDNFSDKLGLLKAYEREDFARTYVNDTNKAYLKEFPGALNLKSLLKKAKVSEADADSIKAQKIYQFVVENFKDEVPLYRSLPEYLNPISYFTAYGHGQCGVAASLVTILAEAAGLKTAMYELSGHVVAIIYHNNAWRIYDALAPANMIYENGLALDHLKMEELGAQAKLKLYNYEYGSRENNYARRHENYSESKTMPKLYMYPFAKYHFLRKLYLTSTDNAYDQVQKIPAEEFIHKYDQYMSNYLLEIKLKDFKPGDVLNSSMPITGVFIQIPQNNSYQNFAAEKKAFMHTRFINIQLSSEEDIKKRRSKYYKLANDEWPITKIVPSFINSKKLKFDYLDFSMVINHLEPVQPKQVIFHNLDQLKSIIPEAKILILSHYSKDLKLI